MNIIYIDHYAGSIKMGMEFRPYYFACEWKKAGHNIRIIAADYSHLRKENPTINKDFEITLVDGIEYQWIKTRRYEGNGINRAMTMFQFCYKLVAGAKLIVKDFKPDVVISSSTYPIDTYPAQKIAKIAKCRYIHEVHDLWPLTLIELGGMKKTNPFVFLLGIAEKSAYKKSDAVVSVAPNEVEYMLEHGLSKKSKCTCIQNGIVVDDWNDPEPIPDEHKKLFDELHNAGNFVIAYLGGHALSNALDVFIDAATDMSDDAKVAFVLIGKGVEKERLIKKSKNLKNVFFLPPVNKKQVPLVLQEADALYIGAEKCSLYRYGVSMNKVYDYMMSGKPIIYGVEAYNNDVRDAGAGITIEPNDAKEIQNAVEQLMNMEKTELKKMGDNGRRWVMDHYDYSKLSKQFEEILKK